MCRNREPKFNHPNKYVVIRKVQEIRGVGVSPSVIPVMDFDSDCSKHFSHSHALTQEGANSSLGSFFTCLETMGVHLLDEII